MIDKVIVHEDAVELRLKQQNLAKLLRADIKSENPCCRSGCRLMGSDYRGTPYARTSDVQAT